jgi:hypothetical protein
MFQQLCRRSHRQPCPKMTGETAVVSPTLQHLEQQGGGSWLAFSGTNLRPSSV